MQFFQLEREYDTSTNETEYSREAAGILFLSKIDVESETDDVWREKQYSRGICEDKSFCTLQNQNISVGKSGNPSNAIDYQA